MPTILQFRRGTSAQNNTYTGSDGELTVDTDLDVIRIHDSQTVGGKQLVGKDSTQTLTNKTLTSPTLTTPTLGVASATSINKVAITAPATGSTLTIADGKTLTASNTLTFTGTDSSSVAFGSGGTVLYSGGALGTPSSATLTNATGLPVGSGISGLGTGVATFLATPSSANLISAITDETGTGALVFANTPTLVTPNIGAATGTSLNLTNINLQSNGNATISGTATISGALAANGGISVDTNAFTVADTTGNTAIAGTLNVTGTTTLGNLTIGSTKTIDVGANKVTNVAEPTVATDAATKQYVDTIAASSLHYHSPVRVESPTALTATYANGTAGVGATLTNSGTQAALVIDGITLNVADRVLIYTQANAAHNGVYTVTSVGSGSTNWVLTRALDADNAAGGDPNGLGAGDAFYVKEGTTGAGELYVMNTTGTITVGTTAINFAQISSAQIYSAGTGLTLTGTQYSVNASQTQITAVGTLTSGTWNASVIAGQYGGTGVANTGKTITLGGNLTTSGAFATTLTATATTSVTLPTTGTLATLAGSETLTNKTIAAGSNTISGLTNSNLSGTAGITNANLANSSVTIGSTAVSLGTTVTTFAGLSSVTSTTFVGALTGNATNVTGTVAIANGGTGQTSRQAAMDALAGAVTAGQYLRGDGTDVVMSAIQAADVPTLNQNTTGNAASATVLQTTRAINGVNFNGSAAITVPVNTSQKSDSVAYQIPFVTSVTAGNQDLFTDSLANLTYNPSTNTLACAGDITSPNFYSVSDERLKSNIQDSSYGLTEVMKLRSVQYDMDGRHEVGLLAQNVEEHMPEFVTTGTDGIKKLDYAKMVSVLVKTVQQQQAQIDELKSKVGV